MTKKIKQKTTEQLHDEIMDLFIGQKSGVTLIAMVETLASMSKTMGVPSFDVVELVVEELAIYEEMEKQND